jgi:putative peptidoglycan lipid II flippase
MQQQCNRSPAQRRIVADTVLVGFLLSVVKALGGVKVILTGRVFGASDAMDAYLVALLLPAFCAEAIAGSLSPALVPALVDARASGGAAASQRLYRGVLALVLAVLLTLALLFAAASPLLLNILALGFPPAKRLFAQHLFLCLLVTLPLSGLNATWRAVLNSQGRFFVAALAPAATPILTVLWLLTAADRWSVWGLVAMFLTGAAIEACTLTVAVRVSNPVSDHPLQPAWQGWDPRLRGVIEQYLPVMFLAAIMTGRILIDQSMAATLGPGSVAALDYGTRLTIVLLSIGTTAVGTAVLPHLSQMAASSDWPGLRRTIRSYGRLLLFAAVPATAILIAASEPLVRLVFERGAFGAQLSARVAHIQQFSLLQIPFALVLSLLLRLAASLKANKLLLRVALVAFLAGMAGNYLLMKPLGLPGIALAGAGVQLLSLVLMASLLRGQIPSASHPRVRQGGRE